MPNSNSTKPWYKSKSIIGLISLVVLILVYHYTRALPPSTLQVLDNYFLIPAMGAAAVAAGLGYRKALGGVK